MGNWADLFDVVHINVNVHMLSCKSIMSSSSEMSVYYVMYDDDIFVVECLFVMCCQSVELRCYGSGDGT